MNKQWHTENPITRPLHPPNPKPGRRLNSNPRAASINAQYPQLDRPDQSGHQVGGGFRVRLDKRRNAWTAGKYSIPVPSDKKIPAHAEAVDPRRAAAWTQPAHPLN